MDDRKDGQGYRELKDSAHRSGGCYVYRLLLTVLLKEEDMRILYIKIQINIIIAHR